MAVKPSIVFAHGIWADGSCFSKVILPLRAEGYEVMSAQYGLNSNVEDVAATAITWVRSAARRFSSAAPTVARSSPPRAPMTAPAAWSTSPPSAGRRQDLPETAGLVPKTALLDKIKVRDCNGSFAVLAPSWA